MLRFGWAFVFLTINPISMRIVLLALSVFSSLLIDGQDIVEEKKVIDIDIKTFKEIHEITENLNNHKQPLTTKKDVNEFIGFVKGKYSLGSTISSWIGSRLDYSTDKHVIVFLQHSFDLNALSPKIDEDRKKNLMDRYEKVCSQNNKLKALTKTLESVVLDLEDLAVADAEERYKSIAERKALLELLTANSQAIQENEKELAKLKSDYEKSFAHFVENEKVEQFILHKENNEWSEYLLQSDEILIVILGGEDDIANLDIKVENGPTRFEASLNDLKELAGGLGVIAGADLLSLRDSEQQADCSLKEPDPKKETIKCTFVLLKNSKIKPPSKITLENKALTEGKSEISIHEKSFFDVKVGVSGALIDNKNLSIDDQNNLTVSVDDDQKKALVDNFSVLFEISPWGRDVDRLEPVWSKNRKRVDPGYALNRFGVVMGFKLSKDPLEMLVPVGVSYGLSNELSLFLGLSYHAVPKDQVTPVGNNATLSYLKENISREYKPSFFFGLALSPRIISKAVSSKDE